MGFRRRPALRAREIWILVGIGAATLVVVNILIGADILLSRSVGGGGAFFSGWAGARAVLWQHADPYSIPVVRLTQQLTYGGPAAPGENPYLLTVPFFLLPIYFPFALTASPSVARGLWLLLGQAALVGTCFLALAVNEAKPRRAFVFFHSLAGVFGLYSVVALIEGAPAILLGLLLVGVLGAYGAGRDELAGALLVLCLFDWEAGGVLVLLILLRVLQERRWNVLAGGAMALIILGVISFLIFPNWLLPFLASTLASIRGSFGMTSQPGLEILFPNQAARAAQVLSALAVIMLIYEWWTGREAGFRRFMWTASLALAVTPLLGFGTSLSNIVVLLPSVGLICVAAMQRRQHGGLVAAIFLALSFFAPWYVFARWIATGDGGARGLLLLVYPGLIILGLYWTRWWFIHPQQTWIDQIRDTGRAV